MSNLGVHALKRTAWAVACLGVAFGLLGEPMGWYARYPWYDELLHAITSFSVTLLVAVYARGSIFNGLGGHRLWKLALIAGAGVLLGVVWEIGEWFVDHTVGAVTVKSKYDTSIDLLVDFCGALVGSFVGLGATHAARPARAPGFGVPRMSQSAH